MPDNQCSFCGHLAGDGRRVVVGAGASICGQCVGLCVGIVAEQQKSPPQLGEKRLEAVCSFCGKANTEVARMIAGPGPYVCDECVRLIAGILDRETSGPLRHPLAGDVNVLLAEVRRSKTAFDQLNESLRPTVQTLRGRGVSWARIGEALGVSRQAAWERFSGED
jgi:ATP-dependent protease Clp ATPase subunit